MEDEGGTQLSPEELVAVVDQLPVPVTFTDLSARLRYVNAAAEAVFGYGPDALGTPALGSAVAASDTSVALDVRQAILEGRVYHGRFPVRRPDGSRLSPLFVAAPVYGRDGALAGIAAIGLELADPARALAADELPLRAQAEEVSLLLESVLANAPIGLAVFDRSLRWVRANDAIAAMNGVPQAVLIGQRLTDVLPGLPPEVANDIASVFETGKPLVDREVQGETPAAPGVSRCWTASYFPATLRGEVRWVGVVVKEVTTDRKAEAERTGLLMAERQARDAAEAAARRLATLQAVTAELGTTLTTREVARVIVTQAVRGLGATAGALCVVDPDTGHVSLVEHTGFRPDLIDILHSFSVDADLPAAEAIRTGEPVLTGVSATGSGRRPSGHPGTENGCFVAVPLVGRSGPVGVLPLSWAEGRTFSDEDRLLLVALAQQAAQALERVRLHEAEIAASERQSFLAEASRVLASSLDYEETLVQVARLAVPEMADVCSVRLLDDNGLRMVALATAQPVVPDVVEAASARADRHDPRLLEVVRTRQPALVRLEDLEPDTTTLPVLRALGARVAVVVPMTAHDRVVGVLALAMASSGREYHVDDLAFVSDLGARAGTAIANAQAHRSRVEVASTLQRSLLPPRLPVVPGIELAARYHPVGDGSEVGGDFYDAFPLGSGRWGLVVGDVCGKGVRAASLTALARYTLRAAARAERVPSSALKVVNGAVLEASGGEDAFCTVVHAHLDISRSRVGVTVASGGHPLPLLVGADGAVTPIGKPGTGLGLFVEPTLSDETIEVHEGQALVFYTDGVREARAGDGRFADDLLEATVSACAGSTADGIASALEEAVLSFQGGRPRDDMAILVVRVPCRLHYVLEPAAASVPEARQALAAWLDSHAGHARGVHESLLLTVSELVTNSIGVAATAIQLDAWLDGGEIIVDVSDDGMGFVDDVPSADGMPDVGADHGRGLFIVRSMMDDCRIQSAPSGTVVRCRRRIVP